MTTFYNEHSKVFLSVDCIIFGFDDKKLKVLVGRRKMDPGRGEWSLYGGFVGATESVDEAATRTLFELTGLRNLYMRQIGAFGKIDRDPGERVVSIAYYALINVNDYDVARAYRFPPTAQSVHTHAVADTLRGCVWHRARQTQLPQARKGYGLYREDRAH